GREHRQLPCVPCDLLYRVPSILAMEWRTARRPAILPAGFTEPCNPTVSERPPRGPYWFMKSSTRLPDDRPARWRAGARLGDIPRNDLARPRRRDRRPTAGSQDSFFGSGRAPLW